MCHQTAVEQEEPLSDELDPEQALGRAELLELLEHELRRLDPDASNVIRLFYFQERSLGQIAREYRISRSWACRLHRRAMRSLTKRLRRLL